MNVKHLTNCNLSPRGDGNFLREKQSQPDKDCNLSPRGDGNLYFVRGSVRVPDIAIYPREGTETDSARRVIRRAEDCNLSPRGDGNFDLLPVVGCWENCNLSPRGDGNAHFGRIPVSLLPYCNLSPRGDGNVRHPLPLSLFRVIAIYPREGTETQAIDERQTPDRKIAIYPREGTETCSCPRRCNNTHYCNLSPRGDGNTRGRWC